MVSYPLLSQQQQRQCPKLKKAAKKLPVLFADSTHQLWQCDSVDGLLILKVCNHSSIQGSSFWKGMNKLFKADFPANLLHLAANGDQLAVISPLEIPEIISVEANRFVLARWLYDEPVELESITDEMVSQLASHIGKCHQQTKKTWGAFHHPVLSAEQWPMLLHETIMTLAQNAPKLISDDMLKMTLQESKTIQAADFVPIMPDLRWDQFLQKNGRLSALVDLDAFVYGPRELELVLLEYLLTSRQIEIFKKQYGQYVKIPDLTVVRRPYRVLLFFMNVLGEQNLDKWLNRDISL